jgi:hypothetical protein
VEFTFPAVQRTLLVVNSTAAPGDVAHDISIGLTSPTSLGGLQFTLEFDASVLTVDSLSSTDRVSFPPFYELSINGTVGEIDVVLVDLGGDPIPSGSGVLIDIFTSVNAEASVQDVALTITGVQISAINGNPVGYEVRDGAVRIR